MSKKFDARSDTTGTQDMTAFDPEVAVSYYYKVIVLTVTHPLYINPKFPIKSSGLLSY
jgi:hypothetical protein